MTREQERPLHPADAAAAQIQAAQIMMDALNDIATAPAFFAGEQAMRDRAAQALADVRNLIRETNRSR